MKPSKTISIITDSTNGQQTTTASQNKLDIGVKKILCPLLARPNEVPMKPDQIDEKVLLPSKEAVKKEHKKSKHHSDSSRSSRDRISSDEDRKKSKHRKDRKKERSRRSRSRSNDHRRNRRSESNENRNYKKRKSNELPLEPVVGEIYDGTVSSLMQFGCFVQIKGLKKPWEGLVHISNLRKEGRVSLVSDVVSRHQKVKVTCISFTGTKVGLSMKDVDQKSGEDQNPQHTKRLLTQQSGQKSDSLDNNEARNPDRPDNWSEVPVAEEDLTAKKKVKQISDFEKWEIKQLIAAKAIKLTELPDFDEETGILQKEDDSDEDIEIEVIDDESVFLKGRNKQSLMDLSPVKIVKNPDGSLSQAAMMQGALAKERREIKIAAQQALIKGAENDDDGEIARPDDPFAFKQEAAATANKGYQLTEWKKSLLTGSKGSYGKKTTLSIIEQREGLPIYRLKDELIKAVHDNQILVVIGETGSLIILLHLRVCKYLK